MLDYIIHYKHTRNWYARINMEWKLEITIPFYIKRDKKFQERLIAKWEQLLSKYQKRNHIQTHSKDSVMLFWEIVSKKELPTHKKLDDYLQETLAEYATPLLDKYSKMVGKDYYKLTIRKTKTKRWSCTSNQFISINLQLIHLPTQFIKYVIIHEVCHLTHKNHWPKFRELVEKLYPNHKLIKKELKNFVLK